MVLVWKHIYDAIFVYDIEGRPVQHGNMFGTLAERYNECVCVCVCWHMENRVRLHRLVRCTKKMAA